MADECAVRCRAVSCGWVASRPVLRNVDVCFGAAEIVAVIGGSGSGKSTLLRTVAGLLLPLAGKVEIFGEDLYGVPPARRRELLRRTGMLFQREAMFGSMTIVDNVSFPLRYLADVPDSLARQVARSRLAQLGLSGVENRLPDELSGGQRKRAALARALVRDPAVLFCDEPTSGLDPETAVQVDRELAEVRDVFGVAIIAVTHDVDSVRTVADRAIVVGQGRIVAEGAVSELERSEEPLVFGFFNRVELARRRAGPRSRQATT